MKVFMLCDFGKNNGSSIANRDLRKALLKYDKKNRYYFSRGTNLILRILEDIYYGITSDITFVSDYTRMHLLSMICAKLFGHKVVCRVHGHISYEMEVNGVSSGYKLKKAQKTEASFYRHADWIVCVSNLAAEKFKKDIPSCSNKTSVCYNIKPKIKPKSIGAKGLKGIKDTYVIVSTGGGARQKNNLSVAIAIDYVRMEQGWDIKYIVAGPAMTDKHKFARYAFVEYYEDISHEKMISIIEKADLYIQNSVYETFGLAVLEAATVGTSVLLSSSMGVKEVLAKLSEKDIIADTNDINEISEKIVYILKHPNGNKVKENIRNDLIAEEKVALYFVRLFNEVARKNGAKHYKQFKYEKK